MKGEIKMSFLNSVVNGFGMGIGLCLAYMLMHQLGAV